MGEITFIRALCYFYLVNFYGEIPLALTSDYRVNGSLARMEAVDNIYNSREGYEFVPVDKTTIPDFVLTPGLLGDFEPGDLRRTNWVDSNKITIRMKSSLFLSD